MNRKFINMDIDNTNYGYWWVDFINENGEKERKTFDNDLEAKVFYDELMSEQNPTQSE
jgi:hypothetical protein